MAGGKKGLNERRVREHSRREARTELALSRLGILLEELDDEGDKLHEPTVLAKVVSLFAEEAVNVAVVSPD